MVEPSAELPDAELAIRGGAGRRASLVTIDQVISWGSALKTVREQAKAAG